MCSGGLPRGEMVIRLKKPVMVLRPPVFGKKNCDSNLNQIGLTLQF